MTTRPKAVSPKGTLIIIGGHEDKSGDRVILSEVAQHAKSGKGRLVLMTVATELPAEVAADYQAVFGELGLPKIDIVDVRTREDTCDTKLIEQVAAADVVFFTGGDQLRITSQMGGSPLCQQMRDLYYKGGLIVGTSAGAAVMPNTMLVAGPSDSSMAVDALSMAPGLNLLEQVVIDSHFAERGRMGRLVSAVAHNPYNLGIGIDEDTAIILRPDRCFEVLGNGAVYVVDGSDITFSNLAEGAADDMLRVSDVRLHILGSGDRFDIAARRPLLGGAERTA